MRLIKTLKSNQQLATIKDLMVSDNNLSNFFETEEEFLSFRRSVLVWLMGNDPAIMNITVTSDIIQYNDMHTNNRAVLEGNMVKSVSDKQSFVYNPYN